MTKKHKKTKNPKVGSLVYDKDQKDWGIIIDIEKRGKVLQYTIQFIDEREPIILSDVHKSSYQECYE